MKLSACLITKNEERCLARCIDSFIDIVDELVLVDTGSTDRTIEIAERYGAKICHFEWVNDFSAARNFAIGQSGGDWIFMPDADEWFRSDSDAQKFRQLIEDAAKLDDVYAVLIDRCDIDPDDPGAKMEQFPVVRSFRNIPACRFTRPIHEVLAPVPGMHSVRDGSGVTLLHDGYGGGRLEEKLDRNNEILLAEMERDPSDDLNDYYLGDAFHTRGEDEKALEHLMRFIKAGKHNMTAGIRGILVALAAMEHLEKTTAEKREVIAYALRQYPEHPSTYLLLAQADYEEHRMEAMLRDGARALELKKGYRITTEVRSNLMEEQYPALHMMMARAFEMKNQPDRAVAHYTEALALDRENGRALDALANILCRFDQREYIRIINSLYPAPSEKELAFLLSAMRAHLPKEAFMTYFEKLFLQTKRQDINFIVMLTVIGRYEQSFELLRQRVPLSEDIFLPYLVWTAVLSGDERLHEQAAALVGEKNGAMIRKCRQGERCAPLDEEQACFHTLILRHMAALSGAAPAACAWADMRDDADGMCQAGTVFYERRLFDAALERFLRCLSRNDLAPSARADAQLRTANCYFMLGDAAQAAEYLSQSVRNGMNSAVADDLRGWIAQM